MNYWKATDHGNLKFEENLS